MRFYRWASSSEGNSGIRELHIKGWADDFELSWRLQEAQPFGEGEWIQEAPAEWDEEGPLTDMPFNPNFHLVSPRLRALLEELGLGAEIQFLPVRVAIGEARVFRVEEFDLIVVIREDVKAAMEGAGITGCWFQELEVV